MVLAVCTWFHFLHFIFALSLLVKQVSPFTLDRILLIISFSHCIGLVQLLNSHSLKILKPVSFLLIICQTNPTNSFYRAFFKVLYRWITVQKN